jgi:hypothetical protein
MFRLQGNHHQGANSQYLAKITLLVQYGYIDVVQTLSVLWLHRMRSVCYALCERIREVILCSHNTDNVCTTSMYPH